MPIERSHEVIDRIERDASRELGIFLVIHMDPIETKNELVLKVKRQAEEVVSSLDTRSSIHDFRMVDGEEQINLIFDLVVPREYSESQENALMMSILERLQEMDARYQCVITVEKSYVAEK